MVQNWLQYTHLDKLYGYLPWMPQAASAIFGLDPAAYAEIIAQFNQRAAGAADRLLDDQRVAGWVDALPFTPGQKVLAVGDSTTDDLQSWAVIFRNLLRRRRGQDHIDIINAGLSAHSRGQTGLDYVRSWHQRRHPGGPGTDQTDRHCRRVDSQPATDAPHCQPSHRRILGLAHPDTRH